MLILDDQMLAVGTPDAAILRALVYENAKLDPHDRVTIDSIRDHTSRHFPASSRVTRQPTGRSWSGGLSENQVDFVEGVAIALTPIAFYEVVMAKAFRTLVDDRRGKQSSCGMRSIAPQFKKYPRAGTQRGQAKIF